MRNASSPHAVMTHADRHERVVAHPAALEHALDDHQRTSPAAPRRSQRGHSHTPPTSRRGRSRLREQVREHARRVAVHDAAPRRCRAPRPPRARRRSDRRAERSARPSRWRSARRPRSAASANSRSRCAARRARARGREGVVVELEDDVVARRRPSTTASRSTGNSSSLPGCVIMST